MEIHSPTAVTPVRTRCESNRQLLSAPKKRRNPASRNEKTGPLGSYFTVASVLGVNECKKRTDKATCYFPIAD